MSLRQSPNSFPWIWILVVLTACQDPLIPLIEKVSSPAEEGDYLERIVFTHPDTGYIVGGQRFDKTLVLKTFNGGHDWDRKAINDVFTFILFDLISDQKRVLGVGLGGLLMRSPDEGENWSLLFADSTDAIRSVKHIQDSVLIAVGGIGYNLGQVLRSEDFGLSWTLTDTFAFELRDLFFTDDMVGYACGYGSILKTEDAGRSWNFTSAKDDFFSSIYFPTAETGYAVGRGGSIIKTTNAGDTWTKIRRSSSPTRPNHRYNHVEFIDPQIGYVLGDKGVMLKTSDGGDTWQSFEDQFKVDLLDMHIFDEGDAFIVGSEGSIFRFRE